MIKSSDLHLAVSAMVVANSEAFTTNEKPSEHKEETVLWDSIKHAANMPIFFLTRDKQKKTAAKELANFGYTASIGAAKNKDYLGARKHATDTINGLWRVLAGDEVVDIILEEMEPIFVMLKNFDDIESPKIDLLIASTTHSLKKRLLLKGLYNGPLL